MQKNNLKLNLGCGQTKIDSNGLSEFMQDIDISVTVTTYNRPKMISNLIKSFLLQSYKKSELLIIDDCVEDQETRKIVEWYQKQDNRIRYIKNEVNLGFSKNFLKSLIKAKGKYIITLGDDDLLINIDSLKRYIEIFEKYPKVSFIYSNILQFNQNYNLDYIYKFFKKDKLFSTPAESLRYIWLRSCYIAGIGLRNNIDFTKLYPKEDILFPQVELIGKILGKSQAYGIGDFLIGGCAHQDQLGFKAIKGERIKKNENHSMVELYEIFKRVTEFYEKENIRINITNRFLKRDTVNLHASILPTEKINTGNFYLIKLFFKSLKKNKLILLNLRYLFYFSISLITPKKILFQLKEAYKKFLINKNGKKEKLYFNQFIKQIKL